MVSKAAVTVRAARFACEPCERTGNVRRSLTDDSASDVGTTPPLSSPSQAALATALLLVGFLFFEELAASVCSPRPC